jgi:heme exporter protein A
MRLIVDKLSAERGGETVFAGISFALGAGEALVVTGPNGSGKSTLLRVVAGLLPARAGNVRIESAAEDWQTVAGACHYLGHQNAMKTALTVGENLRFWQNFNGEPHLSVGDALAVVGLPQVEDLPHVYLSTGQKRRVSIARLLVSYRPVWLLDEPTAGLDAASERQFAELVRAHLDDGGMIVAATHVPLGLDGAAALDMESR